MKGKLCAIREFRVFAKGLLHLDKVQKLANLKTIKEKQRPT